jgi:hypothetical protein
VIRWVSMYWDGGAKEEVPSVVEFWFKIVGVGLALISFMGSLY